MGRVDVVAIDWSGRATGAERVLWTAHVRDGRLLALEDGRDRTAAIDAVIALGGRGEALLVGLDFSFSFPAWWCAARGWRTAPEVWAAMRDEGEGLLAACAPPLWGRPGTRAQTLGPPLRRTEARHPGAKSTFQIGGAGAVGTGAIRGMPHLLRLREAGFAVWPFDPAGPRTVVEVYPRTAAAVLARVGASAVACRAASRARTPADTPEPDARTTARACRDGSGARTPADRPEPDARTTARARRDRSGAWTRADTGRSGPSHRTAPAGRMLVKGREDHRRAFLTAHLADQDAALLERAARSEDAFDATVAAFALAHDVATTGAPAGGSCSGPAPGPRRAALPVRVDPTTRIEGEILPAPPGP
jgi:hypothetical protein